MKKKTIGLVPIFIGIQLLLASFSLANQENERDLEFFLHRLRTVEHLPLLENSHTAMSSTWDVNGHNEDGNCYKKLLGKRNILLDVNGPGCIHRIFTGRLGEKVEGTKIQIFLDNEPNAVFDMSVNDFFDDTNGPIPYPLVFHKTYPGTLFPIPFSKHCLVQLVNEQEKDWGNYWQVTYTIYPAETKIKSLSLPLTCEQKQELAQVCKEWLRAESEPPAQPEKWSLQKKLQIQSQKTEKFNITGTGIIREMRISVKPNTPEVLRGIRMQIYWDNAQFPSVDVPLGYFFGNADYGDKKPYSSILLGVTGPDAYSRFPMPFNKGAIFSFTNHSDTDVEEIDIRLDILKQDELVPISSGGRFHVTWTEQIAWGENQYAMPHFGKADMPTHVVLERTFGPGKYVGVLLHVDWPLKNWWGEGDWLIWTDEHGWPPSYHGTGSEEYFNSGWCKFDRKAVSGFIKTRPGNVAVYSFHLNDAFQFKNNILVAEEKLTHQCTGGTEPKDDQTPCIWGSTAYWYALPVQPAGSRQDLVKPRLKQVGKGKYEWKEK